VDRLNISRSVSRSTAKVTLGQVGRRNQLAAIMDLDCSSSISKDRSLDDDDDNDTELVVIHGGDSSRIIYKLTVDHGAESSHCIMIDVYLKQIACRNVWSCRHVSLLGTIHTFKTATHRLILMFLL
jgi:hypothetical protein